jgi:FlaA1/EpsC-like NDP-sugar epimerase
MSRRLTGDRGSGREGDMGIFYPIPAKKITYPLSDAAIVAASYLASYFLRYWEAPGDHLVYLGARYCLPLIVLYIASFYFFQIYRIMWNYSNISDVYRLMQANIAGFVLFTAYILIPGVHLSPVMLAVTFLSSVALSILYRILLRDYSSRRRFRGGGTTWMRIYPDPDLKKIMIIGAGEAGRTILSEYAKKGLDGLIVGFADDDAGKLGKILNGKMVYCSTEGAGRLIDDCNVNEIIIAMPSVASHHINRIVSGIRRTHRSVPIKVLPPALELDERKPLSISLRDISIADLIGREEVDVDTGSIEQKYSGKTILVTGAGGSIGREMCCQLLKYDIKKLVAVGRGEYSMYNLIKTMNENALFLEHMPEISYHIIDVKDRRLLSGAFSRHHPDIVFHAAAHKHVPLMEFNEAEAVQNNVGGTKNVLDCVRERGSGEFVLISTDKAVHPSSIMGATKRIAEIVTGYYFRTMGVKTSVVRFGNVIGSRGSVIPLFMEQIERGGPVTVTHPEVTRYFMSIPEASLLVLNAAAYSTGGKIYVLDMGRQYRVAEIARRLIALYGYRSDDEIKIMFTGLRPGEKMHEDLFNIDERYKKTENDKIFVLPDSLDMDPQIIESFMDRELPEISRYSADRIREIIKRLVPEFESVRDEGDSSSNLKLVN